MKEHESPYDHLLKPKAGGIGFIISSMNQHITSLLDVTLVYTEHNHSLWDFLCKRVRGVKVFIKHIPIPHQFITTELINDQHIQNEFKQWLNEQWAEKDRCISLLKNN